MGRITAVMTKSGIQCKVASGWCSQGTVEEHSMASEAARSVTNALKGVAVSERFDMTSPITRSQPELR